MTSEDEFLGALRATFMVEAAEHLQTVTTGLLQLEAAPAPEVARGLVDTVFRAAHSLKGAARAVDLVDVEARCQSLEDVFAGWRRQAAVPASAALDAAHRTLDAITASLAVPGVLASTPPLSSTPTSAAPLSADRSALPEDTVRITVAKLDARVLEAEEMLTAKLTTRQRADDLRALTHRFATWRKDWTAVEPEVRALRQVVDRAPLGGTATVPAASLARVMEFMDWSTSHVKSLATSVTALTRTADQDRQTIGRLVDDLLEDSKKLLLLPFATVTSSFPKLVRDLSQEQGKDVELVICGAETEIDKRILEEMKDPLIHLLRNAVDHGIETPQQRRQSGKPVRATVTLTVSRVDGNQVALQLADDGAGIDVEKVKSAAVEHGLLSATDADRLGEDEALRLIFAANVTTSPMITRLSGRGLGLAIVREKADRLGGTVAVESQPRRGTQFSIVLPSMLATFRGILVEAAERLFVVPTVQVERVVRLRADQIRAAYGRDTVTLDGRAVALVRLADVLQLPRPASPAARRAPTLAIILGASERRVLFAVDAAHDEQEVLVKPLRKPLVRVRNIAGATVLASGRVAPILNVSDLLKSARRSGAARSRSSSGDGTALPVAKVVLVAEDSITSRTLIKSILEAAGYTVKTAVDGLEAFALLRAEHFDLLVSDVEMPRLGGLDLTARVRADQQLGDLPIVLVTARETLEDRQRGIDAGASAYIVKSSFDQSNLLDAVRRLA